MGTICDLVIVLIDRYLKMIRYITYFIDIDVAQLANKLIDEVFLKFKVPWLIMSDRGSIFTSKY